MSLALNAFHQNINGAAKFLKSESKEEFDMIAEKNPVINKAVVRLAELSQDERARMLYESRQMLEWDIAIDKREVRREAREEGRKEGEKNTTLAIVKNALQLGLPSENIVKLTGLSYEEIENLRNAD